MPVRGPTPESAAAELAVLAARQAHRASPVAVPDKRGENLRTSNSQLLSSVTTADDQLGKLIVQTLSDLAAAPSYESFVQSFRGKGDLQPTVGSVDHPAAAYLASVRADGATVQLSGPDWTADKLEEAIERGPHASADEHTDFVREEFCDMVRKRFWVVVPAAYLVGVPGVRLSPLGVVPQAERRPRIICDYTYYGVNDETVSVAPPESMQFGQTLRRCVQRILQADPANGPVLMAKFDYSDGYYRVPVSNAGTKKLATLLPRVPGESPMAAVPLVLPMGWNESVPCFCATTETITDLVNDKLRARHRLPPHKLEAHTTNDAVEPLAVPIHVPFRHDRVVTPLAYADVYLDDIIVLIQPTALTATEACRVVFHASDEVYRPLEKDDEDYRTEPFSVKKLARGDGTFATSKEVLGWVIDTLHYTITLAPRRTARLHALLAEFPRSRRRVSLKKWQQVLGELRSMAPALAGSRGLFGPLQKAFAPNATRLHLSSDAHDFLDDFRWLARRLVDRPMTLFELLPDQPTFLGATDASGLGMGGVIFVPHPKSTQAAPLHCSFLWRHKFPADIATRLVSASNPKGTISNSDLELAGTFAQLDIIARSFECAYQTIAILSDNTPAVYWNRKGSATTTGPAAYLLRLAGLHQRVHRYVSTHDFIPGKANAMADDASRLHALTDSLLLLHFNTRYPQPVPWQLLTLPSATNSAVTSSLYRKRYDPVFLLDGKQKRAATGHCGWSSAPRWPWTPPSPTEPTQSHISKSSDIDTGPGELHHAANPSELARWTTPCVQWARRTKAWGPETSGPTTRVPSTSE